ncbi:hypothetical protein CI610_02035 [invertebrate metagenome]|uniref:Orotate phosphoribosyltransferase n=1 Tax=invertebrate metagenome TaxID=1711999 RepID=A0A2H9T704_9ZZZZ
MDKNTVPDFPLPKAKERNIAVCVHLLPFLGFVMPGINVAIPLAVWYWQKNESSYIAYHAQESLNFQITVMIVYAVWAVSIMILVGLVLLPLVPLAYLLLILFMVRAAIMASKGSYYRYPLILRLIR